MNPLEAELRRALTRKEPAAGFSLRVLERVEVESKPRGPRSWTRRLWLPQFRWAAVALVGLLALAGTFEYRRYQRVQAQGEQAREQVMLALQIASSKLNGALGRVEQVEGRQTDVRAARRDRTTRPAH